MTVYKHFIFILLLYQAEAFGAQSYRVSAGSNQDITEWSTCANVNNTLSGDLFVPTNTAAEWSAFQSNPPTGVTVGTCGVISTTQAIVTAHTGSGASVTLQFASTPKVGNTIIVWAWSWKNGSNGPPSSVTDNNGNTYTNVSNKCTAANNACSAIFFTKIVTASTSPFIVTVNAAGAAVTEAAVAEVKNLIGTFDKGTSANGSSTSVATGATATTTTANEFIASVSTNLVASSSVTFTPPAGWTIAYTDPDNVSFQAGQGIYKVVSATGAYSATTTIGPGGAGWAACIATFK